MRTNFFLILIAFAIQLTAAPATKPPGAWDTLHNALHDGNPDHRRQALVAVGTIGPQNLHAVHLVVQGLQDSDPLVRQTAAAVLGDMKPPAAVPYLKKALSDTDEVAFSAAKALADMGDMSGESVFVDVLSGQRKDSPGMLTSKIREAKSTLRHPSQLALMGMNEASGALLGPGSMGIVAAEEAFRDSGASGRIIAVNCLIKDPSNYAPVLLEWALTDSNWGVRAAAAKGVGERGTTESIAKLRPLLIDAHNGARTMAAAAIIRLSHEEPESNVQEQASAQTTH
jgi:HEAT repeat protein